MGRTIVFQGLRPLCPGRDGGAITSPSQKIHGPAPQDLKSSVSDLARLIRIAV